MQKLWALSERSLSQAGESLKALLARPVRLELSDVLRLPVPALPALLQESGNRGVVALQFQITGEGAGHIIILFPMLTIFRMLRTLLGGSNEQRSLSMLERSAVEEVGNVLASGFLTELSELVGRRLMPSPPQMHVENIPQLIQQMTTALGLQASEVLVIQARIQDPESHITGRFFVLPEVASLEPIVQLTEEERRPGP